MANQPDHIRAFISIKLDEAVLHPLQRFHKELDKALPRDTVRWTFPEQLHLTLMFLGNVRIEAIGEVQSALASIGGEFNPLNLRAEGLGGFPSLRNPRVIWVGLQGDVTQLEALTTKIEEAMAPWAEKEEKREFHPHLTLGRVRENASRQARAIGQALQQMSPPPFGEWRAEQFYLMRSQLSPQGAVHTIMSEFSFIQKR